MGKNNAEWINYTSRNQGVTVVYDPARRIYLVGGGQDVKPFDVAVACSLRSQFNSDLGAVRAGVRPSQILKVARFVADGQELKGCFTSEGNLLRRKTTFDRDKFLKALPDIVSLCSVQLKNPKQDLYV